MVEEVKMKWENNNNNNKNKNVKEIVCEHEDIRRSIEILDNVLAEFDDGALCEPWLETNTKTKEVNGLQTSDQTSRKRRYSAPKLESSSDALDVVGTCLRHNSFQVKLIDGNTSLATEDEHHHTKTLPPPVPKRKPTTRLSKKPGHKNTNGNAHQTNKETPASSPKLSQSTDKLEKAGVEFESMNNTTDATVMRDQPNSESTFSGQELSQFEYKLPSVAQRRAEFEKISLKKVQQTREDLSRPLASDPATSPKKFVPAKPPRKSVKQPAGSQNPKITDRVVKNQPKTSSSKVPAPSVGNPLGVDLPDVVPLSESSTPTKNPETVSLSPPETNASSSSRKSSNQDQQRVNGELKQGVDSLAEGSEDQSLQRPDTIQTSSEIPILVVDSSKSKKTIASLFFPPPPTEPCVPEIEVSLDQLDVLSKGVQMSPDHDTKQLFPFLDRLTACVSPMSDSGFESDVRSLSLNDTIEDLPRFLPTDTLKRPHLGLSCMEEDMFPEFKSILTSTPKRDKSTQTLDDVQCRHSYVDSFGHCTSISGIELEVTPPTPLVKEKERVPFEFVKSSTLPTGLKLGSSFTYTPQVIWDKRSHSTQMLKEDDSFRSSSAPPAKHLQKKDKKHFNFSKKDKKKSKSGIDSTSLDSDISTDGSIVFHRIVPIEGDTGLNGSISNESTTSEEKVKKKSIWKSILRKNSKR